jgi:hypothetical protein
MDLISDVEAWCTVREKTFLAKAVKAYDVPCFCEIVSGVIARVKAARAAQYFKILPVVRSSRPHAKKRRERPNSLLGRSRLP